jgi:hypothetical protein
MRGQKWILENHFDGEPKESDLQLVEEELPDQLEDNGHYLCKLNFFEM